MAMAAEPNLAVVPVALNRMSTHIAKLFVTEVKPYDRVASANPIKEAFAFVDLCQKMGVEDEVKKTGFTFKCNPITRARVNTAFSDNPGERFSQWNTVWAWPPVITPEEPIEIWIARIIIADRAGSHLLTNYVDRMLQPTKQLKGEGVANYQARIQGVRRAHQFLHRAAGHLFTTINNDTLSDQYLCKGYQIGIMSQVAQRISALVTEHRRLHPEADNYVPTANNYINATLAAEAQMLDIANAMTGYMGLPMRGTANVMSGGQPQPGGQAGGLAALVRPQGIVTHVAPATRAPDPPAAAAPRSDINEELLRELRKQRLEFGRILKRCRDDESDDDHDCRHRGNRERSRDRSRDRRGRSPPRASRDRQTMMAMDRRDDYCADPREPACRKDRRQDDACYNCNQPGHRVHQCRQPCRPGLKCPKCKKHGHFARDCADANQPAAGPARNANAEPVRIPDNIQPGPSRITELPEDSTA
jgi:hypothetical protein